VAAARRAGRDRVGCIILGRGEDDQHVRQWLTTAAAVSGSGFTGFAVGRTTFWGPLVNYRAEKITRDTAVAQVAAPCRAWWTCSITPNRQPRE
jgi:myo-inositol catabolism protein IolC